MKKKQKMSVSEKQIDFYLCMFLINSAQFSNIVISELNSAADSASETDDNHQKSLQKQVVMKLIQATILQIMIERNLMLMFSNRQKNIAVADQNTKMITKIINFFSRTNNVLIKTSNVEMKNINLNY